MIRFLQYLGIALGCLIAVFVVFPMLYVLLFRPMYHVWVCILADFGHGTCPFPLPF